MRRLSLLLGILGLVFVGAVGCQHATDGEPVEDAQTAEQASEATLFFRTQAANSGEYLHFGFHPEAGWSFYAHREPLPTLGIDREMLRAGGTDELKDGLRTAAQAQGQGQGQGQGDNGNGDEGFLGGITDGTSSSGPTYSASATSRQRFSARSPGAGRFTASSPAPTGGSSVFAANLGNPRFSSSAAAGAGQSCSLRTLCDFTQAVCEVYPGIFDSTEGASVGCGAISQCYSYIDQAAAEVTAELTRRQVCQISTLFGCAADTIRRVRPQIDSADEGAFAVLGSIFVCLERAGFQDFEASSSGGDSNSENNGF